MQWWTNNGVGCHGQLLGQMKSQQYHRMHTLKSLFLLNAEMQTVICFSEACVSLCNTPLHLHLLRTQKTWEILSPVLDLSPTSLKSMFSINDQNKNDSKPIQIITETFLIFTSPLGNNEPPGFNNNLLSNLSDQDQASSPLLVYSSKFTSATKPRDSRGKLRNLNCL